MALINSNTIYAVWVMYVIFDDDDCAMCVHVWLLWPRTICFSGIVCCTTAALSLPIPRKVPYLLISSAACVNSENMEWVPV